MPLCCTLCCRHRQGVGQQGRDRGCAAVQRLQAGLRKHPPRRTRREVREAHRRYAPRNALPRNALAWPASPPRPHPPAAALLSKPDPAFSWGACWADIKSIIRDVHFGNYSKVEFVTQVQHVRPTKTLKTLKTNPAVQHVSWPCSLVLGGGGGGGGVVLVVVLVLVLVVVVLGLGLGVSVLCLALLDVVPCRSQVPPPNLTTSRPHVRPLPPATPLQYTTFWLGDLNFRVDMDFAEATVKREPTPVRPSAPPQMRLCPPSHPPLNRPRWMPGTSRR